MGKKRHAWGPWDQHPDMKSTCYRKCQFCDEHQFAPVRNICDL